MLFVTAGSKIAADLFQFNDSAGSLKFLLELLGIFLLDVLFNVLRSAFNHFLGFLDRKSVV